MIFFNSSEIWFSQDFIDDNMTDFSGQRKRKILITKLNCQTITG